MESVVAWFVFNHQKHANYDFKKKFKKLNKKFVIKKTHKTMSFYLYAYD
jgi:hypothetical protein